MTPCKGRLGGEVPEKAWGFLCFGLGCLGFFFSTRLWQGWRKGAVRDARPELALLQPDQEDNFGPCPKEK